VLPLPGSTESFDVVFFVPLEKVDGKSIFFPFSGTTAVPATVIGSSFSL